MAYDPETDIDEGDDIEGHAQAQDRQDALEEQPPAALPQAPPPVLRRAVPGPAPEAVPAPAPAQPSPALERVRARYAPSVAGFKVSDDEAYTFNPPQDKPSEEDKGGDFGGDLRRYAMNSIRGWGQDFIGAGKFLNDQLVGSSGVDQVADKFKAYLQKQNDENLDNMSPTRRNAARANILRTFGIGPDKDEQGNPIPSPFENGIGGFGDYLAQRIVGVAAPIAALFMLPEEGIAATAVSALAFGTSTAGGVYNTIVDAVAKKPDAEYRKDNQAYDTLRAKGVSEQDAKAQMVNGSWASIVGAFFGGAAAGVGFGKVIAPTAASGFLTSRAIGAGEGAATMGLQSGVTNVGTQTGLMQTRLQKEFDTEGLAREVAEGAIGGAALGGAMARRPRAEAPPPDVDPAAHAALIYSEPAGPPEAGPGRVVYPGEPPGPPAPPQGALPLPQPPPGGTEARPQREMFTPQEQGPRVQPGQPAAAGEPPAVPPQYQTAPIGAEGERTPGYQAPQPPSPALDAEGRPIQIAGVGEPVAPQPSGQLTGAPSPPPSPGPVSSRAGGMPGARQEDLPINQTPPVIVPTTGQGEMFPSLPEANPAVQGATVPLTEERPSPPTAPPAGGGAAETPPSASKDMSKKALVEELATTPGHDLTLPKLNRMKKEDLAKLRDRLNATRPDTTVVTGADRDRATGPSERPAQTSAEETAPPVPGEALTPSGAPEGGAPEISPAPVKSELTGQEPAPKVRPGGGPSSDTMAKSGEGIAPEVPAEKVDPRDVAMEKLANVRRVVKVPRGTSVERMVNDAFAEMQREISKSDGSTPALLGMLQNMIKPREGDAPGAHEARRGIAAKYYEEVTGKKLVLRRIAAKATEDTRPEVEQVRAAEEQAHAAEATAKAASAEAIEEKAAAGETTAMEPGQRKIPKGTDIIERAKAIVNKLLDPSDPMDAKGAEAAYNKLSKAGRPRRKGYETVVDALHTELARVTKPGEAEKLRAQLAKNDQIPLHTREGTEARQLGEERRDTKSKQIAEKLEDYAPERIAKILEHIRELSDPVKDVANKRAELEAKMAARKGEPPPEAPLDAPEPAGINPRSSRYVTGSADPRLGANYEAAFGDRIRGEGAPVMAREAAQMIAQDPMVRAEQGPLREVAERFAKLVPHDVAIMSPQRALAEGRINQAFHDELTSRTIYGAYDPESRTILHNIDTPRLTGSHVETALHEMSHAISWHYLNMLERSNKFHPDLRALHAIRGELARHVMEEGRAGRLTDQERQRLMKAIGNNHELHTQMFTDPVVQGFAASRTASQAFLDTMRSLGHPTAPGQSVWRSFANWVRKAIGQPPAKSASEFTLFDHIIKPVTDIQDRAVEYNRQNLPKDPLLRSGAEPVYDGVYDAVRSMSEGVRREMPWLASGAMERSRPKTLAITNMDQIVPRYHATFQPSDRLVMPAGNPLVRVRDAGEAIVHRTKQFIDSFADRGNKLITDAKSLAPARQDVVSKLINDATMANVHLAGDNPHLTTPDQLAAEAALKARYHALSPEEQRVEQAFPKIHGDMDATERAAKLEGILANVFPESTEAQRAEWGRITSSKDRLDAFEANPDTSALAREYGPAWADKYGDLAKVSAKAINAGWQRGDFVPLRRHGDFGIAYGERGTPSEGFERFDTRGQAEERHAQLARENTPNLRNVDLVDKHAVSQLTLGNPLIEQLNRALERRPDLAEHADDIRDMMNKLVLEGMSRSDGSRMHRRNIQGASLDFTRTLAKELQDTAVRVGYYAHGGERFRAVADMRRIASDLEAHGAPGQSREARQVITEIEKHVTSQENTGGATAALARRAGTFGYMQSLSSLSHLMTSTIENYSMAYPQIAARHGYGATAIELGRVGKSLILPMLKTGGMNTMRALGNKLREKDWNVADVIADHLRQSGFNGNHVTSVFNMLKRTGLIDHSYARELKRLANPEGLLSRTGRVVDYFNNLMGVWSHSVDAMNRANVAMTSFNLEFRKTGDAGKALAYAEIRAREASPNYNLVNKNRFSTSAGPLGGAAGPITQFKQYGFFSYGILGNAAKQSLAKMPSEMRTEARYALAGMLATHALTAGAFTLIADPLRYIMGMYDWMTGATKPHDYQADLRGYLDRAVGPELGQFIARGAIDTFLGASTHRRVGFANVLEIPPLESFDLAGVLKMIGTAVVGASGEDATKFATGLQAMGQGHIYDGIKSMIPRPIRDAMTAHELATKGVVSQQGRMLLPPEKITPWDVGLQAFGFQPSRVSEAREGSAAIQQRRDEAKEGHTKLIRQWVANPENHASIMDQVTKFNLDPNNQSAKVTMKELHNAEKEARKLARHPEAYGLRLPKKGQQNLIEAGSFANI